MCTMYMMISLFTYGITSSEYICKYNNVFRIVIIVLKDSAYNCLIEWQTAVLFNFYTFV